MIKRFLAVLALAVATTPAFAEDFNLGSLGVPSVREFGNIFSEAGNYVDNYTFSISQNASAGGLVVELDPLLNWLNLDITSVALSGVGTFAATGPINFGILAAGTYTLSIASQVKWTVGIPLIPVAYAGVLTLSSTRGGPVTSVPEPGVVLLYGLGLLGVAFAVRRRRVAGAHG